MAEEKTVKPIENLDPRLESALELAQAVKTAVVGEGDVEGHSFEDEEILGQRAFHINGGCCG